MAILDHPKSSVIFSDAMLELEMLLDAAGSVSARIIFD